ncbi:proteasome-activating ATPase [Aureococcus anophagefferens]|nr:proteasome-activating ATPase [Aureococcus anophagefferens]
MAKGECQTSNKLEYDPNEKEEAPPELDEGDIELLKTYGNGPYTLALKKCEDDIKKHEKKTMQEEQPLQVARCTKIIDEGNEDCKYVINVKQIAKFVVGLGEDPLPPKIDPTVSLMTVEDKPDVRVDQVGGAKSLEKLQVVELPLLHPERFLTLGIDPPKGVLLYGPPGTGKTLSARAVANRTDACFIRVIGSELVQKYVGEGARMVRELFTMARSKKACIIFFDELRSVCTEAGMFAIRGRRKSITEKDMIDAVSKVVKGARSSLHAEYAVYNDRRPARSP